MPLAKELRLFLLCQSWQQCASHVFAFSPSSQRDFDGTTAHHFSFMNSLAASRKLCLLVGSDCFSVQSPFGSALQQQRQTSSHGICPQLLSVTGCPSAISGKDHFKDTKLEEERVCLLCFTQNPLHVTS